MRFILTLTFALLMALLFEPLVLSILLKISNFPMGDPVQLWIATKAAYALSIICLVPLVSFIITDLHSWVTSKHYIKGWEAGRGQIEDDLAEFAKKDKHQARMLTITLDSNSYRYKSELEQFEAVDKRWRVIWKVFGAIIIAIFAALIAKFIIFIL